ncbi:hypothetical protein ACQKKG_09160 [Brevundimonas sp. NPDC003935]|uniref:hypothetical protein n=2 Tax=Brevundimonas TaxID=41275 RepID=UPI0036A2B9BE
MFLTTSEGERATVRPMARVGGAMALALAVFSASAAYAEGTSVSPDLRAGLSDSINVKLTGRIDARCLLSGGGEINLGELRGGEGAKANFGLDCNVPFNIDIQSKRGGLAHATMPQGQGPFVGLLEYDLQLTVPTLRPDPALVEGRYTSRELLGERTLSSGDGIGAGGGTLELRMRQPEGAGLLAGSYAEILSLTVTPRM